MSAGIFSGNCDLRDSWQLDHSEERWQEGTWWRWQVYVAVHNGAATRACRVHLAKGARSRLEEDAVASRLVLRGLAASCGLDVAARALDTGLLSAERLQNGAATAAASHPATVAASPTPEQLQARATSIQ